jgi:hypothetical protein
MIGVYTRSDVTGLLWRVGKAALHGDGLGSRTDVGQQGPRAFEPAT